MPAQEGWFRTDQNMANRIGAKVAGAKATYPPYVPYIVPDLATDHWLPANPEYRKLDTGRVAKMEGRNSPQPPPTQSWIPALLRFIFTADLCLDLPHFGCGVAQFSATSHFLTSLPRKGCISPTITTPPYTVSWVSLRGEGLRTSIFFGYQIEEQIDIRRAAISDSSTTATARNALKLKGHKQENGNPGKTGKGSPRISIRDGIAIALRPLSFMAPRLRSSSNLYIRSRRGANMESGKFPLN